MKAASGNQRVTLGLVFNFTQPSFTTKKFGKIQGAFHHEVYYFQNSFVIIVTQERLSDQFRGPAPA
jgi:hypothetical protein